MKNETKQRARPERLRLDPRVLLVFVHLLAGDEGEAPFGPMRIEAILFDFIDGARSFGRAVPVPMILFASRVVAASSVVDASSSCS